MKFEQHHAPHVLTQWAQLGAIFDVAPLGETPDVERLLLETARHLPHNPRLLSLPATWLVEFAFCVAKLRLAHLAEHELETEHLGPLGLLLESAQEAMGDEPFRDAIDVCAARLERADPEPRPLFALSRRRSALAALAEKHASPVSQRWRHWAQPVELRPEAVRSPRWVMARNPELQRRADLLGDLRCSIIETLRHDPEAGRSAMELQRRCHLRSYPPVLNALKQLERSGTIERIVEGASKRIRLLGAVAPAL